MYNFETAESFYRYIGCILLPIISKTYGKPKWTKMSVVLHIHFVILLNQEFVILENEFLILLNEFLI